MQRYKKYCIFALQIIQSMNRIKITSVLLALSALSVSNAWAAGASDPEEQQEKYWKTSGNFQGKYTQTYYSDNWYKGGESNHSVLASTVMEANYAKKNTTLDNMLEMKLGFITEGPKGERTVRNNEDLLRVTSKFGLKAFEAWYYSAQLQGYTQFMPVWDPKNPDILKSRFMAPAYGNFSIGMDYKPKFEKNDMSLSMQFSPLSLNCRYVAVDSIAPSFGIEEGKNFKYDMGCRFETNFKCTFLKVFTLNSKFQYFSSFKRVETNFENTIDYKFSKYFSLQLFTHWRFDDSVMRNPDMGYHQFKELLTFNFNYAW